MASKEMEHISAFSTVYLYLSIMNKIILIRGRQKRKPKFWPLLSSCGFWDYLSTQADLNDACIQNPISLCLLKQNARVLTGILIYHQVQTGPCSRKRESVNVSQRVIAQYSFFQF